MAILRNPKHEMFAILIFEGIERMEAYRRAGFNGKGNAAKVSCCQLLKSPNVAARLHELREVGRSKMEHSAMMSVEEKRSMLADMARFDKLKLFKEDGSFDFELAKRVGIPGWCLAEISISRTQFGDNIRIKFPDPVKAIEADSYLAGHGKKPGEGDDKPEVDVTERTQAADRGRSFLKQLRLPASGQGESA